MATQTVTISLSAGLLQNVDRFAETAHTDRSKVIADALALYFGPDENDKDISEADPEVEAYHLACIREGIRQADAGMLHPAADVMARVRKRVAAQ